jgi:hypothetical protein
VVPDPLFWLNPDTKSYEPLTPQAYDSIVKGKAKI